MITYLNLKTSQGRETVEEIQKQEGQSNKEHRAYVRSMVKEYHLAGMNVYTSSRCCSNWK